mmetsp:Transcript_25638/g.74180  ORF Transcript_25638/g.74180 Transcript_25638/m.74180 type:complete len:133 (+) Transcript_25638:260-658(+)
MGTCQSKRDLLPADSLHVMLGVKNNKELRRLQRYSQEDEVGMIEAPCTHRPCSSVDQHSDDAPEQRDRKQQRRESHKRKSTMDTFCSWGSGETEEGRQHNAISKGLGNVCSAGSSTALVEPTPNVPRCGLAA